MPPVIELLIETSQDNFPLLFLVAVAVLAVELWAMAFTAMLKAVAREIRLRWRWSRWGKMGRSSYRKHTNSI